MAVAIGPSRAWGTGAGLACMFVFGVILLAAAGVIVLSLISLYVPMRDNVSVATASSGQQKAQIKLATSSNLPAGSSVDTASLSYLANQMMSTLSGNKDTKSVTGVNVISGVTANSNQRKRRQTTTVSDSVIIVYELFFKKGWCAVRCQAKTAALANVLFAQLRPDLSSTLTSTASTISDDVVTGDISKISQYWSNLRAYQDNPENIFGVTDTGLPDGCQVEQAFIVHRHASRYPTDSEFALIESFAEKISEQQSSFTGPLAFLKNWQNQMGLNTLLIRGYAEGYTSGANFWTKYGRILYNASVGQVRYDPTDQPKLIHRSNTLPRVYDTARAWMAGFFGLDPTEKEYNLLQLPLTNANNTLASYASCKNVANPSTGFYDGAKLFTQSLPYYLQSASTRLSAYSSSGITFNVNDSFAMQSLCAYEYASLGYSDFCSLFTINEWKGFEYVADLFLYTGFSFGSPLGRALGIGYVEELIARLKGELITESHSTVNTTLDSSADTFPLNQPFYYDGSHDLLIVDILATLSIDYFRENLSPFDFPPPANRHFKAAYLTPFAGRLITEKIGCVSPNPTALNSPRTYSTPTQYGYDPDTATYKFIRMRANNGILPLNTIRGGYCNVTGRTDGLCSMDNFLLSQTNASALANYEYVCLVPHTYNSIKFDGDGTFFAT